jgi:hypothetical protein
METLVKMAAPQGASDHAVFGQRTYEIKEGFVNVPPEVAAELAKIGYRYVTPGQSHIQQATPGPSVAPKPTGTVAPNQPVPKVGDTRTVPASAYAPAKNERWNGSVWVVV